MLSAGRQIMMHGLEENVLMSLCLVSLSLGLAAVMAFCVLRLPVDYYEEALVPAQEAVMLQHAFVHPILQYILHNLFSIFSLVFMI